MRGWRERMSQGEYALVLASIISVLVLGMGVLVAVTSGDPTLYRTGFGMLVVVCFGGMIGTAIGVIRHPSDD